MTFQYFKFPSFYLSYQPLMVASKSTCAVLNWLLKRCNWRRAGWWSRLSTIATDLGVCRRTVQRAIRYLAKHHLIEVWRRVELPGGEILTFAPGQPVKGWEVESEYRPVPPALVAQRAASGRIEAAPEAPRECLGEVTCRDGGPLCLVGGKVEAGPGCAVELDAPEPAQEPAQEPTPAPPRDLAPAPPEPPAQDEPAEVTPPAAQAEEAPGYRLLKGYLREGVANAMVTDPSGGWREEMLDGSPALVDRMVRRLQHAKKMGAYRGSLRRRWVARAVAELADEVVPTERVILRRVDTEPPGAPSTALADLPSEDRRQLPALSCEEPATAPAAEPFEGWSAIREQLREQLGPQNFQIWIQPMEVWVEDIDAGPVLICGVPNRYYKDWVGKYYGETIEQLAGLPVQFVVAGH